LHLDTSVMACHYHSSKYSSKIEATAEFRLYLPAPTVFISVPKDMKFLRVTLEGYISIDVQTMKNLNLIKCHNVGSKRSGVSLFSALNFCKAPMGVRMLRANLVQPPSDSVVISSRLDTVSKLLDLESNVFEDLGSALQHFPDVDLINLSIGMSIHFSDIANLIFM
jgi:hypothetical protein